MSDQRAAAAKSLARIAADPNRTIDRELNSKTSPLTRELIYGVLRHYFLLKRVVDVHLKSPLRDKDSDLYHLLLVGAYQLKELRTPDHAAVSETVNAVKPLRKPWARKLVNGVLRNVSRAAANEPEAEPNDHSVAYPAWFSKLILQQYEGQAEAVLSAQMKRAPMAVRVNTARTNVEAYEQALRARDIAFETPWQPETLILSQALPQAELPGYAEGLCAVQDAGAQFAAGLLCTEPFDHLLDACAAPGGKLFHAMERSPGSRFTALEYSEHRAQTLSEQATRLGHAPVLAVADATTWQADELYDRILLDAPCTGSGTLRRNPDIKLHRQVDDLPILTALQDRLLSALWRWLKPGGALLYCTCSILAEENDAVVGRFLEQTEDAAVKAITLPTGSETRFGWQLLPTDERTDGFYYAYLLRTTP